MSRRVRQAILLIEPVYNTYEENTEKQTCSHECPGHAGSYGICRYFGAALNEARDRPRICRDAEVFHQTLLNANKELSQIIEVMHQ